MEEENSQWEYDGGSDPSLGRCSEGHVIPIRYIDGRSSSTIKGPLFPTRESGESLTYSGSSMR